MTDQPTSQSTVQPWKASDWNPYPGLADSLPKPVDLADWLTQRRGGIGASECAAILGLDQYQTIFDVWLDKTGKVPLSSAQTEAAEWGHLLEPIIRGRAAERLGYQVHDCAGLASKDRPWQRSSLDGVLATDDGPIPIEVKNTSIYLAEQWADDQVPDRAELQVQHQLAVTGAPYAYVAGLIGGNRMVIRQVERDQELIDHITLEEARFWQQVLDRQPPEITARESLATLIAAAGTADTAELVTDLETATEVKRWAHQYKTAVADEKVAAARKAEARNNLVVIAAGHSKVFDIDGETELVRLQRGVFSGKRFQADHPEEAALFQKKVEVFDTQALKAEDPDLYRAYQSVSVRIPKQ